MSKIKTLIKPVAAALIVALLAVSPLLMVKKAEALSSNAKGLADLIAVSSLTTGGGFTSGTNSLSDLIVLAGLFPTSSNGSTNAKNLAGLIAVDNITGGGSSGGALTSSNNLGSLIVLSGLFPTSTNANTNAKDLAGLIAINNIVGGGSNGGALTNSSGNLGDLLILNNLFLDP